MARFFFKDNLKNLRTRIISGAFIVAVTFLSIRFSPHSYLLFLGLLSIGCSYEYLKITESHSQSYLVSGILLGTLVYVLHSFYILGFIPGAVLIFLTLVPVALFSQTIFSGQRRSFRSVENVLAGMAYTVLPFICLSYLPINPTELRNAKDLTTVYRWEIPMMFFIILMAHDSFAYLSGKFFGRTKLARNISPNKTVEGTLGGVVGSGIFMLFLKNRLLELDAALRKSPWSQTSNSDTRILLNDLDWYIVFGLTVLFAILGDLVESRLKRSQHVKNSSNFFPGHGGFLDRYDSLLLSAIPVFLYIYFFKYS